MFGQHLLYLTIFAPVTLRPPNLTFKSSDFQAKTPAIKLNLPTILPETKALKNYKYLITKTINNRNNQTKYSNL